MKICVLVLGADLEQGTKTASMIGDRIMAKRVPYNGMLPILAMNHYAMDMVLKYGAPMPVAYSEADWRLLLGIDSESTAYLDVIGDVLAKAYERGASAEGTPQILRMSDAVKRECRRQHLDRVWVQDVSTQATELRMRERLNKAKIQTPGSQDPDLELSLLQMFVRLDKAETTDDKEKITNECRAALTQLAQKTNTQAVVLDQVAAPFLAARELSADWGPIVIDAYELYLDAAAEWVDKATRGELLTDHWLESDQESFGDRDALG